MMATRQISLLGSIVLLAKANVGVRVTEVPDLAVQINRMFQLIGLRLTAAMNFRATMNPLISR
jgi:hypothetical protein